MRAETLHAHRLIVARALELIQRDLDDDLALDVLAESAGVSFFHFHRLFASVVGEPPASYVRRLRLERAALRLRYSRLPVTEIAFGAGYETHEAFTRAFKTTFGVPPRQFRARRSRLADDLDIDPQIVHLEPRRIACVRHVGPYDQLGAAFEKVLEWAEPRHLLAGATLIGIYWDDQTITAPDRTRCEVGLVVDEWTAGEGEIAVRVLEGGDYAVMRHHGSVEERRRTYDLLYARWLPERGRVPANAPPFEAYSAYRDLDHLDLVTSVHVPLVSERAVWA